jgi:hypothetical protein
MPGSPAKSNRRNRARSGQPPDLPIFNERLKPFVLAAAAARGVFGFILAKALN